MKRVDYHGALGELATACEVARSDIAFIVNPLQGFTLPGLSVVGPVARMFWKAGVFFATCGLGCSTLAFGSSPNRFGSRVFKHTSIYTLCTFVAVAEKVGFHNQSQSAMGGTLPC